MAFLTIDGRAVNTAHASPNTYKKNFKKKHCLKDHQDVGDADDFVLCLIAEGKSEIL